MPSLKYQSLIEDRKLSIGCPGETSVSYSCEVFRWYRNDWSIEENFLPNFLEPGSPSRKHMEDDEKCGRCALSFYDNFETAISNYKCFPKHIRSLLKKTHIYKGDLLEEDGIGTQALRGHFNFYEFEGVELSSRFSEVFKFES